MEKMDVLKLLMLLEAEYPQSFKGLDDEHRKLKTELWAKEFEQDNANVVFAAARILMRSGREFAPTSGQIREKIMSFADAKTLDEQQAWSLVAKACANGYYGYRTEFEKLPVEVQRAIGRPEQLREWALVDENTLQTVVASNFMRSYKTTVSREKELARIPAEIRKQLIEVADNLKLTEVAESARAY